jgi:hypothetical protein
MLVATKESIDVIVKAMEANCFQFVCNVLDAHNNSQRQKPSPVLSVLERVSLLRLMYRRAELQIALARLRGLLRKSRFDECPIG